MAPVGGLLLALAAFWPAIARANPPSRLPCYMQYQNSQLEDKSVDFENPSVFELLASNYSRSPFLALLHQERECVALSYWINNEPDSVNFRGKLHFSCGIHELLRVDLLHAPHRLAPGGYCLAMRHGEHALEQYGCAQLGLTRAAPLVLQAHVGSMVILSQGTPPGAFDYLLFQRVTRYEDMVNTLRYFETRYRLPNGALEQRHFYTSSHWLRCDCERIIRSLTPLYQCLGIARNRGPHGEFALPSLSEDMLVMAAIGIGGGVTFFLLLKIRLIC